jgi:transcriptional regulator with XRE-family HTH domain
VISKASSLHYSYIGGVERGDRNISLETLEKIITALQVSPAELFRFEIDSDSNIKMRRRVIDEHMAMLTNRTTDAIRLITKINKDIFNAIDSK